jgi:hypothetical protein
MSTLVNDADLTVRATNVVVTEHHLTVDLADGRTISLPLTWYPRLAHGTPAERANVEVDPFGLYWPDLDEDISTKGLILGHRSGECAASFQRWLEYRSRGEKVPVLELPLPPELEEELKSAGA